VFEDNDLDIEVQRLKSRVDTLQELLLETQSDVIVLQKTKTNKRKARKR
jgi:exonuclease III